MTRKLIIRPSFWVLLLYIEISMVFVAAGVVMFFAAPHTHPDLLNPAPPPVVRLLSVLPAGLGVAGLVTIVRLFRKTVVAIDDSAVHYPRGGYSIPLKEITAARCYPHYMVDELRSNFIALWLKDPERFREMESTVNRWGADMLEAHLYLNLSMASARDFEKVCRAMADAGIPVTWAEYGKHSFKELRKKWGYTIGSQVWLAERTPFGVDVVAFTALIAAFSWVAWRNHWFSF